MNSCRSDENHLVSSVANICITVVAPVSLQAFGSTELSNAHPSGSVQWHYGCVSQFLHADFLPLTSLRGQIVIHGVLASRILFNLRQTESAPIGGIFPLSDVPHIPVLGITTAGDSTRQQARRWQDQRPMLVDGVTYSRIINATTTNSVHAAHHQISSPSSTFLR